jgi:hypothetical protein
MKTLISRNAGPTEAVSFTAAPVAAAKKICKKPSTQADTEKSASRLGALARARKCRD